MSPKSMIHVYDPCTMSYRLNYTYRVSIVLQHALTAYSINHFGSVHRVTSCVDPHTSSSLAPGNSNWRTLASPHCTQPHYTAAPYSWNNSTPPLTIPATRPTPQPYSSASSQAPIPYPPSGPPLPSSSPTPHNNDRLNTRSIPHLGQNLLCARVRHQTLAGDPHTSHRRRIPCHPGLNGRGTHGRGKGDCREACEAEIRAATQPCSFVRRSLHPQAPSSS